MKGTLYWDSTGIAINGHNTWLYAKNGSRYRLDYCKLHIVTTENSIIISYHIISYHILLHMHDAMMYQYEQICGTAARFQSCDA